MNWIKEYFNFNKRERNGILALLILLLLIFCLPQILPLHPKFNNADLEVFKKEIAAFEKSSDSTKQEEYPEPEKIKFNSQTSSEISKGKLFEFDPNHLSPDGWRELGIRDRTILTIQKFLSHGGRFRNAEDLKKIYGLRPEEMERLFKYLKILNPDAKKDSAVISIKDYPNKDFHKQWPKNKIDLNEADSTLLATLPGIGEKLGSRIVKFREKLGGFYKKNKIVDIYALSDTVIQNLKIHCECSPAKIKKIDLNVADFELLKSHPYIRYQLANAIIQYRKQHGAFEKTGDLENLGIIDPQQLKKLLPYLSTDFTHPNNNR